MDYILKLRSFLKPYKKQSFIALLLLVSLVVMDLFIPRLIQRIIDYGITARNRQIVIHTALLMVSLSVLGAFTAIGNNFFSIQVGEGVARDLREHLFFKIQNYSFSDLDKQKTGEIMVRLTSDVNTIKGLVQMSLRIGTRAPLLMIGSLILMFKTSQKLAFTILPLLLLTSGVLFFFILKIEPLFQSIQQKLDRLNTVLQENISGIRLVKAFVRAHSESQRFEVCNEALFDQSVKVMMLMSYMAPILTLLVNIGIVIVLWTGGFQAAQGNITTGQIVAFTNYLLTTMTPLVMMTMLSNVWASGIISAQRIQEIMETSPDTRKRLEKIALPPTIQGHIVFEDVSFSYNSDNSRESTLKGINFEALPGETVAILGATGSGKSTLVNLIPRFYDVTAGRILIDGLDIQTIQHSSLLAHIGIVPQEIILFSGTVRDNIYYGSPHAPDEEIITAAHIAQVHDFIMGLPQGYNSYIEQRGMNLSGGQKQRIAIARAILPRPQILILDDSTSAVDIETETKIQNAIKVFAAKQTIFIVAQRISTVLNADKIIVLDNGHIVAEGPHNKLIQTNSIYQEIYISQLGEKSGQERQV
ncbi:ABC transporter ATP-binding protein [Aminobacterium sp. UBA5277]|uniref:ABC transporter ATP-binding protein n=1 Tax=Aminobacterium sp. UBA5277 TaxID=1946029 RepID=UPI002579CE24|nr:ABC transporter ATP-binding protein [Aminobacterium sp. UBA5277]